MTTFCLDPHVHTIGTSLCGKIKGTVVAELYKKAGYDGIIITNHYHQEFFNQFPETTSWPEKIDQFLFEYHQALAQGSKLGLKVFLGIELQFIDSPCDFLVYGLDESFLRTYPDLHKLGLNKFRQLVNSLSPSYNMLIYQAHPFRRGMNPAAPRLLDGIEVHNGNPRHNSRNHLALAYAKINNLKMISGSDFHRLTDLARGGIVFAHQIDTINDLVGILKGNGIFNLINNHHLPLRLDRYKLLLRDYLNKVSNTLIKK